MSRVIVLAAVLVGAVVACATANKTYGPSGRPSYSIHCSGTAMSWGHCYEKAGKLCGERGYEVVDKSGDSGAMVTANQAFAQGSSIITRSMLVECKG